MRTRYDELYSICIAYEQGYGKGLYNKRVITNPYVESDERVSWGIGYEAGKENRKKHEQTTETT